MRIIFTGTPGTGKTSVAKIIAKNLKLRYVDGSVVAKKVSEGFDKEFEALIVDEKMIVKEFEKENNVVIDSHMSHFMSPKKVDLCIVLRCDPGELRKRLEKRGYSKIKIDENVESEIMNICGDEAFTKGHKILEVNTSKKSAQEVSKIILHKIQL